MHTPREPIGRDAASEAPRRRAVRFARLGNVVSEADCRRALRQIAAGTAALTAIAIAIAGVGVFGAALGVTALVALARRHTRPNPWR